MLRNLDLQRLSAMKGLKIVTTRDWMIAALLALTTETMPNKISEQVLKGDEDVRINEKETLEATDEKIAFSAPEHIEEKKPQDLYTEAIKSLQNADLVNPLKKQDFDDFILESYQRQRNVTINKKNQTI